MPRRRTEGDSISKGKSKKPSDPEIGIGVREVINLTQVPNPDPRYGFRDLYAFAESVLLKMQLSKRRIKHGS